MDQEQWMRLRSIGLGPVLRARLEEVGDAGAAEPMRLVEVNRETMRLHRGDTEVGARVLPRVVRELEADATALAVGDWVLAAADAFGAWWIQRRIEPLTHLARRDGDGRIHAVVSNVDTALLVMGLDDDFNLRRLERYLALVQGSGVAPLIVLTKADLVDAARLSASLEALRARLPVGAEPLTLNATAPEAKRELAPHLVAGRTLVMLGSSGAGKSTLTNTLMGQSVQDTGPVRERDLRGQHTTTSRCLFRLPGGACVIDTPGVRTLQPLGHDDAVASSFGDVQTLRISCRQLRKRHDQEPGCAVRASVDADRLRNYHKLLREASRDSLTLPQRRAQLAQWKARGRAATARAKAKRGET
jgi:ribosome biogenesis GTPase / thiamine phosphate phosphatase